MMHGKTALKFINKSFLKYVITSKHNWRRIWRPSCQYIP